MVDEEVLRARSYLARDVDVASERSSKTGWGPATAGACECIDSVPTRITVSITAGGENSHATAK